MTKQPNAVSKTAQYHAACRYVLRQKLAMARRSKQAAEVSLPGLPEDTVYAKAKDYLTGGGIGRQAGIGAVAGGLGGAGIGALIQALRGKAILPGVGIGAGIGAGVGALGGGLARYLRKPTIKNYAFSNKGSLADIATKAKDTRNKPWMQQETPEERALALAVANSDPYVSSELDGIRLDPITYGNVEDVPSAIAVDPEGASGISVAAHRQLHKPETDKQKKDVANGISKAQKLWDKAKSLSSQAQSGLSSLGDKAKRVGSSMLKSEISRRNAVQLKRDVSGGISKAQKLWDTAKSLGSQAGSGLKSLGNKAKRVGYSVLNSEIAKQNQADIDSSLDSIISGIPGADWESYQNYLDSLQNPSTKNLYDTTIPDILSANFNQPNGSELGSLQHFKPNEMTRRFNEALNE